MKKLGKRNLSKTSPLATARSWCAAVCYCGGSTGVFEIYRSAVTLATAMSDTTGG